MTIRELIEHLHTLPPDAECVIEMPFDGNGPSRLMALTAGDVYLDKLSRHKTRVHQNFEGKQIVNFSWNWD